jgi:phosphatidylserine synthase
MDIRDLIPDFRARPAPEIMYFTISVFYSLRGVVHSPYCYILNYMLLVHAKMISIFRFKCFRSSTNRLPTIQYVLLVVLSICLNILVLCRTLYVELYVSGWIVRENLRLGNLLCLET